MADFSIHLACLSCEKVAGGYEAVFVNGLEYGQLGLPKLFMLFSSPVVPGTTYELRMVGIYPGHTENHVCSGGVLALKVLNPIGITAVGSMEELLNVWKKVGDRRGIE